MKYHHYYDLQSVCNDCAVKAGFKPKPKVVGIWMEECSVCGETKPTCSLSHDFYFKYEDEKKTKKKRITKRKGVL